MIEPVCRDQQDTSGEGEGDLRGVRGQAVAEPRGDADAGETGEKKPQDSQAPMQTQTVQERNSAEGRDGERAMGALLTGKQVRERWAGGEQHRGQQAAREFDGVESALPNRRLCVGSGASQRLCRNG